jgi:hypothetical protein
LHARQPVISLETTARIRKLSLQACLFHAVINIHEAMSTMAASKKLHGMTISA